MAICGTKVVLDNGAGSGELAHALLMTQSLASTSSGNTHDYMFYGRIIFSNVLAA